MAQQLTTNIREDVGSVPGLAQCVKDLALSLHCLVTGSIPGLGTSIYHGCGQK